MQQRGMARRDGQYGCIDCVAGIHVDAVIDAGAAAATARAVVIVVQCRGELDEGSEGGALTAKASDAAVRARFEYRRKLWQQNVSQISQSSSSARPNAQRLSCLSRAFSHLPR